MKKKILIGSIIAVVLLTLVSFSSVVGYNSVESDLDISEEENATPIEFKLQRIKELVRSINLREIIVNPEGVIDTLEEVSSILEEEDVRNYIEKSSEEDCNCEEEGSESKWPFPFICFTLMPIWFFAYQMVISFGAVFLFPWTLYNLIMSIGEEYGCYWAY